MSIINKINKTRDVLSIILNDIDFDTSDISSLANEEISQLFNLTSDNEFIHSLGKGACGCNFEVKHKIIPSYKLNIVYYNLQDTKVTKSLKDKIIKLYETNVFDKYSSLIIIINEVISETIEKLVDEINISLHDNLFELSDDLKKEMEENNYIIKKNCFKRCWMFNIDTLTINLKKHRLISEHIPIRNDNDIQEILQKCNCKLHQLPVISRNDIMSKYVLGTPGEIIKISRTSKMTGNYPFYRFIK